MKLYLILAITCGALTAQAQTNPSVTDQIDKGLNKAADKLIEGLFKEGKKTDTSKKTPETKPETGTTSPEGETLKGLGKMLGGMGFDAKPASDYRFTSSYTMKHTNTDKKGTVTKGRTKYFIDKGGKAFGIKYTDMNEATTASKKDKQPLMDMFVMDLEQKAFFTFMTDKDATKTYIGISTKEDPKAPETKPDNQPTKQPKLTKTGKTKTILTYVCDEYLMEGEEGDKTSLWVSQKPVKLITDNAAYTQQMAKNQKQPDYAANKELVEMAKSGKAILGMDSVSKNGEKSAMEMEEIKPDSPEAFSTAGYKGVLDQVKK